MLSIEKQNSSIVEHITAKEKDCSISKAILSDIKISMRYLIRMLHQSNLKHKV